MANKEPTPVLMPGLDGTGLLFKRFVVALPSDIRILIIDYPIAAASLEEHAAAVAARLPSDRVMLAHRLKLVASAKIRDGERIDVPAYYVQAEGDRLVPRTAAEQLRQVFRQFTLLRVPGPHFLLQSSPTVCARLIAGIVLDDSAR